MSRQTKAGMRLLDLNEPEPRKISFVAAAGVAISAGYERHKAWQTFI